MKFPAAIFILTITLCISSWTCRHTEKFPPPNKGTGSISVSGILLVKSDYCGGARPSDDLLNAPAQPTAGIKLYVKTGSSNSDKCSIVDSVISDTAGKFQIDLAPGNYCFVEAWKKEKYSTPKNDQNSTYDTACYRKRYEECDYSIELNKPVGDAQIILQHHCPWTTPCVSYFGPLPPAANPRGRRAPHNE
ncbi:MAG: prealbumin-like fold domain-containing protein [Bacteroidetes bacterium]|nr:prealbumin-like fold domain-containing protein [Bacteroidota bacterium]